MLSPLPIGAVAAELPDQISVGQVTGETRVESHGYCSCPFAAYRAFLGQF